MSYSIWLSFKPTCLYGLYETNTLYEYLFDRNEIKTLEAEKEELNKDFKLSESQTNQSRDGGNVDKLNSLIDERGK